MSEGASRVARRPPREYVRPVRPALIAALLVTLALGAAATDAGAVTAGEAIAALNAQRAANGIPAGITENSEWSQGCAQHLHYLELNPGEWNTNPHDEVAGHDGYSDLGKMAAQSSVLASGGGFSESGANPWESAPIHLMQLLGPALSVSGYSDAGGGCMWTWPGYQRPAPDAPVVYTYPGEGSTIYTDEVADESPFTPGEFVGIEHGARTGPYLYVLVHGSFQASPSGQITAASLTGPSGPLEVRTVDNHTSGPQGNLGQYLPPGGIVIPVNPLELGTTYNASVSFQTDGGAALQHSWSFKTPPKPATAEPPPGADPPSTPMPMPATMSTECQTAKRHLRAAKSALRKAKRSYNRRHTAKRRAAVKRAKKRVRKATRRVSSACK